MRWGLLARSETDRGIGVQTLAIHDNLNPERTLVVVDKKSGFRAHPQNYPHSSIVYLKHGPLKNTLAEDVVRDWWKGLDVVFTVETFYDWDLIEWAKADGVATVVQGNPEFWQATNPQPTVWTWPTRWRLEHLPAGRVLPVPSTIRSATTAPIDSANLRAVHIAGNRAMGDRNGTDLLTAAMRRIPLGLRLSLYSQAPIAQVRGVQVKAPVETRWDMYREQHVLVLPRRYGGLCLPAIEAMSCGLAVMMPNCVPNTDWPIYGIDGDTGRTLRMQTGDVETYDAYVNDIANGLKRLSSNRDILARAQERSLEWAASNTWATHAESYYNLLEDASRSVR